MALTDFTENTLFCKSFFASNDSSMTFVTPVVCVCSFWDDKASIAECLVPGKFYLFKNFRCKRRGGDTDKLEFVMHGNGPMESINLIEENDPAILEISSRKEKYFQAFFNVVPSEPKKMGDKQQKETSITSKRSLNVYLLD